MDHDQDTSLAQAATAERGTGSDSSCQRPVASPAEKLRLLRLGEQIGVLEACRTLGYSRRSYYRWRRRFETDGLAGLAEPDLHRPHPHRRTSQELEDLIADLARRHPELSARSVVGVLKRHKRAISAGGVRGVWNRRGLKTRRKRETASVQQR
jgi:transposase-like protein